MEPTPDLRMAVVGHVEWVQFVRVERLPTAGEIVHATQAWEEPAGGGAVAAVQLAKLSGRATLYTALGDDALGHRVSQELAEHGVIVEATYRPTAQRRAFTFVDAHGERTITVFGDRLGPAGADPLPWNDLADVDGVYFTAGDNDALRAARRAKALVATSRVLSDLIRARVPLDAVVGSRRDPDERYQPGVLDPPPKVVVLTEGSAGGTYMTGGGDEHRFPAAPLPGPIVDAYGCGDSFAAGLTFGLGTDLEPDEAIQLAARCGAACLTGRGPYEGQLRMV